ncbi:MAG: IPT/TIG domain-containing protein [Candidatus Marinimicrobia bacterium]|nr:IPT/TIG domain-containing protein [Candidatus Neomarinimicrobiota bacterium]MCF7923231.1 IPT/TIG domain-containing protein [Candidatus Neomarinimicrobiota bacterium]
MNSKKTFRIFTLCLILIVAVGCEYNDYPDPIWNPDETGSPAPTITAVSVYPPGVAYDGVSTITITGTNYSEIPSENQVTFNGYVGSIHESESSTEQLVVTMPIVITDAAINEIDNAQLLVAVQGAYSAAAYTGTFPVKRAVIHWGGFVGELPAKDPLAVAVDADENVYVAAKDKALYKIDTLGVRTVYGDMKSTVITDMKVGPDGYIYFGRNIPRIYRVPPGGGDGASWHGVGSKIACFDFTEDQNIYCSGKNDSIYFVDRVAETHFGAGLSEDYTYVALRVFDGHVYVAGTYVGTDTLVTVTEGVWKHQILASNFLGDRELVYDWSASSYAPAQNITSLMINDEGLLYLGLSEGDGPAMVTLDEASQAVAPFYEAVLTGPATMLSWGNGAFMYCVRNLTAPTDQVPNTVFKIAQTAVSAPYYGRN